MIKTINIYPSFGKHSQIYHNEINLCFKSQIKSAVFFEFETFDTHRFRPNVFSFASEGVVVDISKLQKEEEETIRKSICHKERLKRFEIERV